MAEHVVVHQGDLRLECLRCGATAAVRLPVDVGDYCTMARAFERRHADCGERDEEPCESCGQSNSDGPWPRRGIVPPEQQCGACGRWCPPTCRDCDAEVPEGLTYCATCYPRHIVGGGTVRPAGLERR